jgi:hypothetical protein
MGLVMILCLQLAVGRS